MRTTITLLALVVALLLPSTGLAQMTITVTPELNGPSEGETFHTGPGGSVDVPMSGVVVFEMPGAPGPVTIVVNTVLGMEVYGTACTVNGPRGLTLGSNGIYGNAVFLGYGQTGYDDIHDVPMGTWSAFVSGSAYYGSGQPTSNSDTNGIVVVY